MSISDELWKAEEHKKDPQKPIPIDQKDFEKALGEFEDLLSGLDIKITQAELLRQTDDAKKLVAELKMLGEKLKIEADEDLKTKVSNMYGIKYGKMAGDRACANYFWLLATFGFAFGTLWFLFTVIYLQAPFSQIPYNLSFSQLVLYGAPKLLLISVLITATLWCGKMYKIGKNIEEINKRMEVGIYYSTITLNNIQQDKDLSSALYLTATRAMFSMPDSGYLTGKDEVVLPTDKLLEKMPSSGTSSK